VQSGDSKNHSTTKKERRKIKRRAFGGGTGGVAKRSMKSKRANKEG